MTAHLLYVTLGPVQDFIAQARRSRDLWYGSHLLSELSRCVARVIAARGGTLIFPALRHGDPELVKCLTPLRAAVFPKTEDEAPLNIANIILAKVDGGEAAARGLAEAVRGEVQKFWAGIASDVKTNCGGLIAPGIDPAWDEQIETFLEFSAAWAPLDGGYATARKEVSKAIAARKNLRDFEPWKNQRSRNGPGVPKSSLDGARETVLRKPKKDHPGDTEPVRAPDLVKRYRIGDGEQLDAVGLVKRAGGAPEQFVPLVNIALAPWLKEAERAAPSEFGALRTACKAAGLSRVDRPDLPCGRAFAFEQNGRALALDASIFLENRVWPVFKEQGLLTSGNWTSFTQQEENNWKKDVQNWDGHKYLETIFKALRKTSVREKPYPYVVCLVADGDGMGAAIDRISRHSKDPAEDHKAFSENLAAFANAAREIVEQKHLGSLVFSGGDDVLAFLPLPTALACAEALRKRFEEIMKKACASLPASEPRPTLSVGLGAGHVLEGMGDLLNIGRAAEKLAKGGLLPKTQRRNALAILVDKRSGGTRSWRARWDDPAYPEDSAKGLRAGVVARLEADGELLRGTLSTRKVFEIAETWRRLPKPDPKAAPGADKEWAGVLASEVGRSLKRADGGAGGLDPVTVGLTLSGTDYPADHKAVAGWIDRLLIAKTFAEADPKPRAAAAATTNPQPPASPAATEGRTA